MNTTKVYMDLSGKISDGSFKNIGRIEITLANDIVPKTCENFRCLCTGEKSTPSKNMWYKNSIFHRVIPGFMAHGGDFQKSNGTAGESIYGLKFPDENFLLKHSGPGLLSMANSGIHSNGSQFFIVSGGSGVGLPPQYSLFGKVVSGIEVVEEMQAVATDRSDRPDTDVVINSITIEES